ncbi:MAG: hypothetical protein KF851_00155 [Pirellulaceae bacterium]|nr:hypothetical protein [Pirellulaceae bacterium]
MKAICQRQKCFCTLNWGRRLLCIACLSSLAAFTSESVFGQSTPAAIRVRPVEKFETGDPQNTDKNLVAANDPDDDAKNLAKMPSSNDNQADSFDPDAFRLSSLLQLAFDRSPQATMKAWADELVPPKSALKEKEGDESRNDNERSASDKPSDTSGQAEAAANDDSKANAEETAEKVAQKLENDQLKKEIDEEVAKFGRWVTLGKWNEIGEYLSGLPKDNGTKVYKHLLRGLLTPANPEQNEQIAALPKIVHPMPAFSPDDFLGLADAAPAELTEDQIEMLAQLLGLSRDQGYQFDELANRMEQGTKRLGGSDQQAKRMAAKLFLACAVPDVAARFLPEWTADEPVTDSFELRLLARYFDAKQAEDPKPLWLQHSWEVHQALLRAEDLKAEQRKEALQRTVELSLLIDEDLGQRWLQESFTENWEQGVEILSQIGGAAASQFVPKASDAESRKQLLTLQNKAAETLVDVAGERASQWRATLTRLAEHWLREAELTVYLTRGQMGGTRMNWDRYGNYFYYDEDDPRFSRYQTPGARPIPVTDMLDSQPSEAWLSLIDDQLRPRMAMLIARLYLKANEEEKAFPHIEQLAPHQPDQALVLVHEFIKTWTSNNDPNQERRHFNPYMYIYGYNRQAEAIPLSRSRQQRNLENLAQWVKRIRQLPIGQIDETLLAAAFTTCHSSAEVFKVEAFVNVFGEIHSLKPETVASLADTMRGNLASVWRQVRVQEAFQTRRREKDVQQEVIQGYQVAMRIVADAREKHPDDWRLKLAEATLMFDENAYSQSIFPTSEFTQRRNLAFDKFQQAAKAYRDVVIGLDVKQQTTDPFDYWFYAALGSTDLGQVSHETIPDEKQLPLILESINSLPGETADAHLGRFADSLFSRMNSVAPAVKHRYLKSGFEIVGDHPRAREARKTFAYYNDVVEEIKLVAEIDGSDVVGHASPFGVMVKLVHTTEMERESGGFEKYAQNQNPSPYYYNYGRPVEEYRDKFEKGVVKSLGEQFEVISVTFENPKNMKSRPTRQHGWRQTPYCYLLLKAKGPQIDRLPPLQLNLDFMDTSGYVVLPIESPAVPLDAAPGKPLLRPYQNVTITQTLDDRMIEDGKLALEVQATGEGLIPELDELLKLDYHELEVVRMDDQGVMPTEFDRESDAITILSDRSWMIELAVKPGEGLTEFRFLDPRVDGVAVKLQRYDDADLVTSQAIVPLSRSLVRVDWFKWLLISGLGLGFVVLATIGGAIYLRSPRRKDKSSIELPREINAFTVLGLLERLNESSRLSDRNRSELQAAIQKIEAEYFAPHSSKHQNGSADANGSGNGRAQKELTDLAHEWIRRAS